MTIMTKNVFKKMSVGSTVMMFVMMLLVSTSAMAEGQLDAKVYMTYEDFVAGNAVSLDSLVDGRSRQICQIREEDYQYRIKTGDKKADKILKKEALVVEYGGQLYVNCRYLRCNGSALEINNYTQAYRYDGNKLCVVAHWMNTGAVLAGMAADVTSVVAPLPVSIPSAVGTGVIVWNLDKLSSYRCYSLDSKANEKGKTPIVRMDDEFMGNVLKDSPELLERFNAQKTKRQRLSAANILPFLKEKGLIK